MRHALPIIAVLTGLAGGVPTPLGAQSSLGGAGSVPPPRAAAPAATPAAPARPAAAAPSAPRPATQGQPRPAAQGQRPPAQAQRPAAQGQRPANQAQRRPQTPEGQRAAAERRRAAQAAAAAAAAAAATAAAAQAAPPQPVAPPEPVQTTGPVTGLPLPRFSALRSNDVNLRVGPERRFPVEWRYQRSDLPVQIIREHDQWRRIRDPEGAEGWVHSSNLQPGRRTFLVRAEAGAEVPLRRRPEDGAAPVARLKPGVIGRVRGCDAGSPWCEVQVQDRRGYLRRSEIFGVMPEEEIR